MKRLFYSLAIIAAVTACNEEMKESDSPVNGEGKTFTAKFEGSKVYMGEDYYYRWQKGDLVSVFTDASHDQYRAVTGNVTETDLEFVSTTAALETTLDKSYAVYPYNATNALEDGVVHTEIAAEQTYSPNGLGNAIMVSETSGSEFVFKNACALVKVNLTIAEDFTNLHAVKSIRVSSKTKSLSGAATINVAGGDYAAKMATQTLAAENTVTLVGCEEAGMLQADKMLTFYLAIPAGTYEAGDLTVSVLTDTESAPFNQSFNLTKSYTVNRSQYIEVTATIAKGYQWFTGDGSQVTINENVTLIDKAIMAHVANLEKQGFYNQGKIETIFDVPSNSMTIKGGNLVDLGYAQEGEDGRPTMTFVSTSDKVFVMNTFTTMNGGWTDLDPDIVTVNNLRITGELRTNTLGIYVKNGITAPSGCHQGSFHTNLNNVDIVDCRIIPYTISDAIQIGAAVCVYGEANLTNCKVTGTSLSDMALNTPEYANVPYYDMGLPNLAIMTLDNSTVGTIYGWEQASINITNKSHVDHITWKAIGHTSLTDKANKKYTNFFYIDDSTIGTLDLVGNSIKFNTSYPTKVTITKSAHIEEMIISEFVAANLSKFIIEQGAQIDKVVVKGTEMTLEEFITANNIKTTL